MNKTAMISWIVSGLVVLWASRFAVVDVECVSNCQNMTNGDYQSCNGCEVYVTCSNGLVYDNRPCPAGLVWDDNLKRCEYTSAFCQATCTSDWFGMAGRPGIPFPPGSVPDYDHESLFNTNGEITGLDLQIRDSPTGVFAYNVRYGTVWSGWAGVYDPGSSTTFIPFDSDEYITRINGVFGRTGADNKGRLSTITITTNKAVYGPYGTDPTQTRIVFDQTCGRVQYFRSYDKANGPGISAFQFGCADCTI